MQKPVRATLMEERPTAMIRSAHNGWYSAERAVPSRRTSPAIS
jgi:hypothetical protein